MGHGEGQGEGRGEGQGDGKGEDTGTNVAAGSGVAIALTICFFCVGIPVIFVGAVFIAIFPGTSLYTAGLAMIILSVLFIVGGIVMVVLICTGCFNKGKVDHQPGMTHPGGAMIITNQHTHTQAGYGMGQPAAYGHQQQGHQQPGGYGQQQPGPHGGAMVQPPAYSQTAAPPYKQHPDGGNLPGQSSSEPTPQPSNTAAPY